MRYIAALIIITLSSSGCLTTLTEPPVYPIDDAVSLDALRDFLTHYVTARQPELSDSEVAAEVERIMASESSELAEELRRARAIHSGLYVIFQLFDFYFGTGGATGDEP